MEGAEDRGGKVQRMEAERREGAEDGDGKAGRCRGWRRESARDKAEKGPALFQAGPFYHI